MAVKKTIQSIHIYPIKSLGAIDLNEAVATTAGLQFDRRWMLVDETNSMITQRNLPHLCQFSQTLSNNQLIVSFNKEHIVIPLVQQDKPLLKSKVWDDETEVYQVDEMINDWFSKHLNQTCKLVRINNNHKRNHAKLGDTKMSLADGYPYLFIGTESLNFLNSKLEEKIPMNRFRPNVVLSSETAHEEDIWETFEIGSAKFKGSHPCGRCTVITIDQTTAEVSKEPLRTLNTYRKTEQRVNFGMNVFCTVEGMIKVGDVINFT